MAARTRTRDGNNKRRGGGEKKHTTFPPPVVAVVVVVVVVVAEAEKEAKEKEKRRAIGFLWGGWGVVWGYNIMQPEGGREREGIGRNRKE